MRKTVLIFLALLVVHPHFGQGSRAQVGTDSEAVQQQSAAPVQSKTKLSTPRRTAPWQSKKRLADTRPSLSNESSANHSAAINHFFKQQLITPTHAASMLAQSPSTPVAATTSPTAEPTVPAGDRMFSNDEAVFSSIYPNPSSTYSFIDYSLSSSIREAKVVLYNLLGTPVGEYALEKDERRLRISTFNLESGFYYYTLFVDGKSLVTRRLAVKH